MRIGTLLGSWGHFILSYHFDLFILHQKPSNGSIFTSRKAERFFSLSNFSLISDFEGRGT